VSNVVDLVLKIKHMYHISWILLSEIGHDSRQVCYNRLA